jgi:hypothetical protein
MVWLLGAWYTLEGVWVVLGVSTGGGGGGT